MKTPRDAKYWPAVACVDNVWGDRSVILKIFEEEEA
jgi:hypothetical protein